MVVPMYQDYGNLNNINNSAGFKYEESRCIHAQKTAIVNEKDHLDWSFDPKDTYPREKIGSDKF
jgi:hypothetical protein